MAFNRSRHPLNALNALNAFNAFNALNTASFMAAASAPWRPPPQLIGLMTRRFRESDSRFLESAGGRRLTLLEEGGRERGRSDVADAQPKQKRNASS